MMKKLLSFLLTFAIIMGIGIPVLAADVDANGGSSTGDVNGTFNPSDPIETVFHVDIIWDSMNFVFQADEKTWNPENHQYEDATTGTWLETDAKITVTNHSNNSIIATPSWKAYDGVGNVTMSFDCGEKGLLMPTADNATGVAPEGAIQVTPGGTLNKGTDGKIGMITVTITAGPRADSITISGSPVMTVPDSSESEVTLTQQLQVSVLSKGEPIEDLAVQWSAEYTIGSSNWDLNSHSIDENGLLTLTVYLAAYPSYGTALLDVTASCDGVSDTFRIAVTRDSAYIALSPKDLLFEEDPWNPTWDGAYVNTPYAINGEVKFNSETIEGLELNWSVQDENGAETENASIDENGVFTATRPGLYIIKAEFAGKTETMKIRVREALMTQIKNAPVIGNSDIDTTNLSDDAYIIIDNDKYVVLARDGEKALLMYARPGNPTEGFGMEYSTEGGYTDLIYPHYGDTASWKNSQLNAWLNSNEESLLITSYTNYSNKETKDVTVQGFLHYSPTIAKIAMDTVIKTRVYDAEGEYTYEETSSKVFLLSEADIFGTVGGEAASAEDYTYVVNGEGMKLFKEGSYDSNGDKTSGNIYSVYNSWLRSPVSNTAVSGTGMHSGCVEHDLERGYEDMASDYELASVFTTYGSQIVPAFWVSLESSN